MLLYGEMRTQRIYTFGSILAIKFRCKLKYGQCELNSDLYPTEIVDIKKFADSIKSGVSCFLTNSNTIKLSGMGSVFTIGLALKRSVDSAAVIMFAYSEKKLYFLFKNNTWDDSVRVLSL